MPKGYNVLNDPRPLHHALSVPITKCTQPKTLALTFDDGPTVYTEALLDMLKAHKARATFFLGGNINGKGELDKVWNKTITRMMKEGHQVASHSWSHPDLSSLTSAERKLEMVKNERAIANVVGKYPTFMRAPMIKCNEECMRDMHDLGYYVVN